MKNIFSKLYNNKLYNSKIFYVIMILIILLTLAIIAFQHHKIEPKVQENTFLINQTLYDDISPPEIVVQAEELPKQREIEVKKSIPIVEKEVIVPEAKQNEYEVWELTAYTSGFESTGKTMKNPTYRITASGEEVKANYTIACPRTLPFGTKIYIPYFDNTFVCKDRGGAIKGKRLDVYIETLDDALEFGRRKLEIKIIK